VHSNAAGLSEEHAAIRRETENTAETEQV